jgi:redox-sensing transcriptional repressor
VSEVVLYGRPGCCLCEDARALLERVREDLPFVLVEHNIELDERLLRRFLERILLRARLAAGRDDLESGPMSLGELATNADGGIPPGERLPLGIAARLSRYLQILTQARKMGRETISSQELASYTHVNSTQIRRDLSGFGKFGKRGVGYNVDSLVAQIRKILRTAGQHNIALFGAGHLGRAIASSEIFADHGFRVVAIFDPDPAKVGEAIGSLTVRHNSELQSVVDDQEIVVGVLAVPTAAAQVLADDLVEAGVKIIFNYSEALLTVPPEVTVHTSSPAVDLLYALYFYLA